jgi:lipopolysaccharide export system permease protein
MLFQRRIFYELVRNAFTTTAVLVLMLVLVAAGQIVHRVEGLDWGIFMRLLPLLAASHIDILIPISVLVAVVLTYGRIAADNEVDTMRACGVHPIHLYIPGLVFGLATTVVLIWGMDDGRPAADKAQRRLSEEANIALILRRKLESGEPVSISDDMVVSVDRFAADGRALDLRIQLFDSDSGDLEREIVGEAEISIDESTNELIVDLRNFKTIKGPRFEGEHTQIRRKLPKDLYRFHLDQMSSHQLMAWLNREPFHQIAWKPVEVATELYMRLSVAVACTLFVFLGIPVALLFRSHDRVAGFLVAFLLALFLYYPSVRISIALAERTAIPVPIATWSGNVFLFIAGVGFTWRAFRR